LSEEKKVDRRGYLKVGAVVVVAGAAAGGYMIGQTGKAPQTTTVTETVTETVAGTGTATQPSQYGDIEEFLSKVSGPYKGQTVRIANESTASGMWLNEFIRPRFEELTGIKIEYEFLGWDDAMRKERLDGAQKSGTYELYYIDEEEIAAEFFENGYIVDWNAFAAQHKDLLWPGYNVADLIAVKYFTYKGMLAGAPFEHFLRTIVYRSDLFNDPNEKAAFKAKYGRELQPPTTYDEYAQTAEFFTRPDEDLYGHVCQPNPMSLPCDILIGLATYGASGGGYTLGRRSSVKNGGMLDSENAIAWLTRYINLLPYGPKGVENFTWDDEGAAWSAGRVAQGWVWTENFAYIEDPVKSPKVAGNVMCTPGITEPKYYRYSTPYAYSDAGCMAMAASGASKEAAFLWTQYATCQQTNEAQMKALKGVAPRASMLASPLADQLDAQYKTNAYAMIRRLATEGNLMGPFFPIAEEPVARDILWKHVEDAIAGKATPKEVLSAAATEIDAKWKTMGWPDLKGY